MRRENGITLVSLVVTIIILIILAGISINLTLGENGIITKAKTAKETQKIAEIKEKISLELSTAETDAILRDENLEQKQLEDIINKYGTLQEDGDTIIIDNNYEISLKEIWYGVLSESGSYSEKVEQIEILEKEIEELQEKYNELEELYASSSQNNTISFTLSYYGRCTSSDHQSARQDSYVDTYELVISDDGTCTLTRLTHTQTKDTLTGSVSASISDITVVE